jgi:hypothetical protein
MGTSLMLSTCVQFGQRLEMNSLRAQPVSDIVPLRLLLVSRCLEGLVVWRPAVDGVGKPEV